MDRKAIVRTFQATNKQNLTQNLDMAKKEKSLEKK